MESPKTSESNLDETGRRRTSFLGASALVLGAAFIALVLFEVFLRLFFPTPSWFERHFPMDRYRDPVPYIMFKGKTDPVTNREERKKHRMNENGYVGKSPAAEKKDTEYRVFVLGGSTVVTGKPKIPTLLERRFRIEGMESVEVFNYGVVSSNSSMELARVVFEIAELSPDLIVFYNGGNDINNPWTADPRPGYPYNFLVYENNPLQIRDIGDYPTLPLLFYGSATARYFFSGYFERRFGKKDLLKKQVGFFSEPWKEEVADIYVRNLWKAKEVSAAFDADFIAFFQPMVYYKEPRTSEEEAFVGEPARTRHALDMRERILEKANHVDTDEPLLFVDVSDAYDGEKSTVFNDPVHTRQEAKSVIAEAMYEAIVADIDLSGVSRINPSGSDR